MTTLPEEAVKAAQKAFYSALYVRMAGSDEAFREAISAALPFLPVQGAVKKLEWTKGVVDIASPQPGMKYVACSTTPKGSWAFWLDHAPETRSVFTSEEVAKAAAQADYEARILSALEPSANACQCTKFQQDETCPVGYPSLLCEICDGKGALTSEARSLALEEVTLERSIERWRDMKPSEVMKGSTAQITYALEDARKDILSLTRALSSPDHNADAGKVEGDMEKWPMREIVAKAIAYHSVGDPHAKTIRGDQRWEWFVEEADKFISVFGYNLPAFPSAPASEGAE